MRRDRRFKHEYLDTPDHPIWNYINKECERTGYSHLRLLIMGIDVVKGRFIPNPDYTPDTDGTTHSGTSTHTPT